MAVTNEASVARYHPDMDEAAHESMYQNFTHFTATATAFVLCIVVGLAIGAVHHAWISCVVMIVLAHIAAAVGLFAPQISWRAPAVPLVILLVMLALY